MKFHKIVLVITAISASTNVNAVLLSRLGGLAYYDDVANLTWLTDANAGAGSTFDDGLSNVDGEMSWVNATAWAAQLNVDGIGGWRLPNSQQPDHNCSRRGGPSRFSPDRRGSYNFGYDCTGSEMGNLFYNILGNTADSLTNTGPFININSSYYWTATTFAPNSGREWAFNMGTGYQTNIDKAVIISAWAVQGGDVSIVPIPASIWLFVSGMLFLTGFAKSSAVVVKLS